MPLDSAGSIAQAWWGVATAWITHPLFTVGNVSFTAGSLVKLVLYLVLLAWFSRLLRRVLIRRVFPRFGVETGMAHALGSIVSYAVVGLGVLVGLNAAGVNLSTLTVLFGALGVGIGFGLQTIASNFVSGLIILLERPIQVGDRIQVGALNGRVVRINFRATEVLTNDNIAVIVPNSEFISQQVINWSHGGNWIRIRVPVGVAYGSDVEQVRRALLEAAGSVGAMLKNPPPHVRLTDFGDSSINFELLGYTSELLHQRGQFISLVNFAVHAALKRHGIQIPFPQRDLHLRSAVPLGLEPPGTGGVRPRA
ncbi:MAG TPA: mechanosensitive ion channel domain-containing protein [Candidatus Polarisedimenticolia bacterium]|nr:mechanosensitive ion channel domain-containing protein [Candidatus Polarisedimenticolia bacterium]